MGTSEVRLLDCLPPVASKRPCLLVYSHSQTLDIFATNVFGPINLTRAVLPHMRARGVGSIVFMSSLAAWLSVAAGGPYSASKCALEGMLDGKVLRICG